MSRVLTGRRAVVGDDLGAAPASLPRNGRSNGRRRRVLKSPTLVRRFVTATVHVDAIRNGSTGDGGRSQKSSPHSIRIEDEFANAKKECPLNE